METAMVHEKKLSGDPDYDDKVPMRDQLGETVTAPDGQPVRITETNGPLDAQGAHVNLDPQPVQDNRPAPGSVATEVSEVQVATPPAEAVTAKKDSAEVQETAPQGEAVTAKKATSPAKGTSSK